MKFLLAVLFVVAVSFSGLCQEKITIRSQLSEEQLSDLELIKISLTEGNLEPIEPTWMKLVEGLSPSMDVWDLILYLMRESYLDCTQDLKRYAEKVKWYNQMKKAIREEIGKMQKQMRKLREDISNLDYFNFNETRNEFIHIYDKLLSIGCQEADCLILQQSIDRRMQAIEYFSSLTKKSDNIRKTAIDNIK